jgi:hypothetical protein
MYLGYMSVSNTRRMMLQSRGLGALLSMLGDE